ncbi:MAG: reverse transcriptase family protein, partial [Cyanobacteria bacterium J06614_10]
PRLLVLLSLLFNCCFSHSFLPLDMLKVLIIPILKDKNGEHNVISNYRPIALSTILSKVMEVIMLNKCSGCFKTSDNQFSYKEKHGTDMAIATLKNVTMEYNRRSTPIYACFMDMSKAFDKVCHSYLFKILAKRGVPHNIINMLSYWYSSQEMSVRWGGSVSSAFKVSCGVKQGSILSPHLFNIYMDGLSEKLNKLKIGCVLNDHIVNHLLYADDIVLFCPSLSGLQTLVNECSMYISSHKLKLNETKTKCIVFSSDVRKTKPNAEVKINSVAIEFVDKIKYLGFTLTSNKDNIQTTNLYRQLCVRSNMLLRNFSKCSNDVKSLLFQSYCTSFYCISLILNVRASDMKKLKVCYNNCIRRLYGLGRQCSISQICLQNGFPTFSEIRRKAIVSLLFRLKASNNVIIKSLLHVNSFYCSYMFSVWKPLAFV